MFSASFARRFVSLWMASFFQRGELLAPDTVGVPADEVRGDEDEHRAHGRGQKQLIRVEIAAGIARVLGEDGRRRLERDGPEAREPANGLRHGWSQNYTHRK